MSSESESQQTSSNPFVKLFVGLVAGCAVVYFPPLIAAWQASNGSEVQVQVPEFIEFGSPRLYIVLFIAALTVIMEWRFPARPWETFVKALSIPALIMGTVSALASSNDISDLSRQLTSYAELVGENEGIPILEDENGEEEADATPDTSEAPRSGGVALAAVTPDPLAMASKVLSTIGLDLSQSQYLIVLHRTPSRGGAWRLRDAVASNGCAAGAFVREKPYQGTYLVLESRTPRNSLEAQRRAIALKKSGVCKGVNPSLLKV